MRGHREGEGGWMGRKMVVAVGEREEKNKGRDEEVARALNTEWAGTEERREGGHIGSEERRSES